MTSRRKRWIAFGIVAGLFTVALLVLAARIPFSSDILRDRLVAALSERLNADVELGALTFRLLPALHAEGTSLTIRHKGRQDVPPLISIGAFNVDADLPGLWNRRVSRVKLDNLIIQIPPDSDEHPDERSGEPQAVKTTGEHMSAEPQMVVEQLEADEARLIILRREVNKPARVWQMHRLRLQNVSANTPMPFDTTLTNAVPPGRIDTQGTFGPWHRDDPGHTPIDGLFTFRDADLSVFKGISGILTAHGTYGGTLETIAVQGETDTPDFSVNVAGHKVPLTTTYQAVVDGTNGNTTLDRIDAHFLDTTIVARGGVYEVEGVRGREVLLDVVMENGRLEDVMKLAVKTPRPPMVGALTLTTAFKLPPGETDVVEKLQLDGRFSIDNGRFTNAEVQQKINEMSLRASGKLRDVRKQQAAVKASSGNEPTVAAMAPRVASDFRGRFRLADGSLALRSLAFDIPGAAVRLSGRYDLRAERLAFSGDLLMDAKVSQTVTGWKSWLLKIADPFFRSKGQTVVPIKINGTRSKPEFGMDLGRVF